MGTPMPVSCAMMGADGRDSAGDLGSCTIASTIDTLVGAETNPCCLLLNVHNVQLSTPLGHGNGVWWCTHDVTTKTLPNLSIEAVIL